MGMGEKPDYIGLKASVSYIKHDTDCWYTACPTDGCNKKVCVVFISMLGDPALPCSSFKVNESMNGNWNCEKCNKEYPNVSIKYTYSFR